MRSISTTNDCRYSHRNVSNLKIWLRFQNLGEKIGRISARISNIPKRSGGWYIPRIPLKDLTANFARSPNPKLFFLPMTACSKCFIFLWWTLRKNGREGGRTGVWYTRNCRFNSPPLTTDPIYAIIQSRGRYPTSRKYYFRYVLHRSYGVYTNFGIEPLWAPIAFSAFFFALFAKKQSLSLA